MIATYGAGEKGVREAARADSVVVVVDAYRASTTVAVLVGRGARVIPVASIEEAAVYPDVDYRIGERGSAKVAGFDFGNSPTEVRDAKIVDGARIVLSSTNGTRIIKAAHKAPEIYTGAFVNAHAVADLIFAEAPDSVAVIGCGWQGRRASEDESAAAGILSRLQHSGAKLTVRAEKIVSEARDRPEGSLLSNTAARRLKKLGYARDLSLCLARNVSPVVPRLTRGAFEDVAIQQGDARPK